jgi:AcrR family transcriptional regulator
MPKISAPTVAAHRERQREALVNAAAAELLENGLAAVTPSSVGKRTGLARSSVYEYFPSASELLAEVALRAFEEWAEEMEGFIAAATPGLDRLTVYIRTTLRMVAEGKHDIADAMKSAVFSDEQNRRFAQLHRELMEPIHDAVRALGHAEPELRIVLIQGVVDAATKQVIAGSDPELVADYAVALVADGVWLGSRGQVPAVRR